MLRSSTPATERAIFPAILSLSRFRFCTISSSICSSRLAIIRSSSCSWPLQSIPRFNKRNDHMLLLVHRPLGIGSRLLCHSLSTSACLGGSGRASTGGDDGAASPGESASTWRKQEAGQLKLNFDGSSKRESQSASIGGAYRDHEGRFVLGYAEPIGTATSSVAELAALRRGLELAVANGWRSVWIEGDNKTVVDVVRSRARLRRSREDLRLWGEIEALLPLLDDMSVSHVRREGNCVADGFAKLGHAVQSPRVWRGVPPDEVLRFLQRDAEVE